MGAKCAVSAACIIVLMGCKHTVMPIATPVPAPPAIVAPPAAASARVPSENRAVSSDKKGSEAGNRSADVNRLLNEPPRMSFVGPRPGKKDSQRVDKITVLVDTAEGKLRPTSDAMIKSALTPLANQYLLVCPDRMRVGTTADCRFATKGPLEDLFREQLLAQGVPASEALETTLLVHADLTSPDNNAFVIRPVAVASSSSERVWHLSPVNAGDHKLELKVTLSARVGSAGEVWGEPVVLTHSVSVVGENFINQYWPAMIGCAALLGLFGWIAMTFWRDARPSAVSR